MKKFILSLIMAIWLAVTPALAIEPGLVEVRDIDGSPTGWVYQIKFSNGSVTINGDGTATVVTGAGGGGDVSSNTATSVVGEVALFQDTSGKIIKRATETGLAKLTSGVLSAAVAGTDYLAPAAIGVTVQAYDADLAYLAGFTPSANVKTILNAADYAAIRTALGLVIGTNVQAWDADLDYLAGFTPSANVKTILNAADNAAIKTALGYYTSGDIITGASFNKVVLTAPATASTLTILDGKTLTINKTMTLTSADDTTVATFPAGAGTVAYSGTLTNTKWCTTDGAIINCTQDTPAGAGTITAVGDIVTGVAFTAAVPGKTLVWNNATSGTVTLQTVAGALGTQTISLPATTGTIQVSPTTVTAGQIFQGTTTAGLGAWSTATYPLTTTANQILYSSSTNTVAGLATGNSGVLVTSAGGVPSISTTLPAVTLTTPVLGVATATSINKWAFTAPTTAATLTAGADNAVYTMPAATKTIAANDGSNWTISGQAVGDIPVASGATAYGKLAAGASGYVLTAQGAGVAPIWATPAAAVAHDMLSAAHSDSLAGTVTAGDIIIANATPKWSRLAKGTQYQTLVMGASLPAWGTLPVQGGGTGIAVGTQYGLPYFATTTLMGTTAAPASTTVVLHGNNAGIPTWSAVVEADITLADNTTNNVSNAKHGFVPKATDVLTNFLRADGTWATPAGAGDVTSVGDCASGACLDASAAIAGTYIGLYNASANTFLLNNAGTLDVVTTSGGGTYANLTAATITSTAADGSRKFVAGNNSAISPTASTMELYSEANIWKFNENGTEYSAVLGATGSPIKFAGAITSGGIPYGSAANTLTSTGALTQYGVLYGGGAGNPPVAITPGTTNQVLTGVTGGAPVFASLGVAALPTVTPSKGGTGVANNDASTITITGNFPLQATVAVDTRLNLSNFVSATSTYIKPSAVTYVPLGATAINDAITAATAGDTLILSAGTYTITTAINVSKQINIVGQGHAGLISGSETDVHGTRVNCATAGVNIFNITANNVRIANMSIIHTGTGSTTAITTANNAGALDGLVITNVDIIMGSSAGGKQAVELYRTTAVLRDVVIYVTSTDSYAYGVVARNITGDGSASIVDCHTVSATTIAAATRSVPFWVYNNNVAQLITMNLYNSYGRSTATAAVDYGAAATSTTTNNARMNVYSSTLNGGDTDLFYDGTNIITVYGGILVNNTYTAGAVFGGTVAASVFTGTITNAANVAMTNESTDTTCFPAFLTDNTPGNFPLKTVSTLTFNSNTGILSATGFAGPLTGAVTGNASTATALAANGANCAAGQFAVGVDASGVAECSTALTSPVVTTSILPSAAGATAIGTALLPFSSIFIGDEASKSVQLINTAAAGDIILTLPSTAGTLARLEDKIADLAASTSAELAAKISDEQGTGVIVFSDSPTFVDDITIGAAGVKLTGANGSLTILGLGDGQDEDIKIDLNTTANTIEITSPASSASAIDINTLNFISTGWIQGGIKIASDADGMDAAAMTAAGVYGTLFVATGAGTWILPTAVEGMSLCLMDSGTAHDLILDVTAGSTIRLKGTEQADGIGITNAAGTTTGDFVCVVAVAAGKWSTMGIGGAWLSQ